MKNFFIKILTVFVCALPLIIIASSGDDDKLRTQVRYQAESAGVIMSDVWTRVQSDRMMVIFGGTLGSTQELRAMFNVVTNYINFVRQVQQSVTTPEGNPYPTFFPVGFDPYITSSSDTSNEVMKVEISNDSDNKREDITNEFINDPKAIYKSGDEDEEVGG